MENLKTTVGCSYWAENGAYSELLSKIWEEKVPSSGESASVHGELARCFGRINYEFNNNGNCNLIKYEYETCPSCDGDGNETVSCFCQDIDEGCECNDCGGSGSFEETCTYCDGEGEIDGEVVIDSYYAEIIDFLEDNLIDNSCIDDLRTFLHRKDTGYARYKFDEKELSIYNAVGDAVGFTILNTIDKERIIKDEAI